MPSAPKRMQNPEEVFYGSVTVGERGQVVIPAEARRELGIETGDKLLAFNHEGVGVVFAKIDRAYALLKEYTALLDRIRKEQ